MADADSSGTKNITGSAECRDDRGRFTAGNPGGPGRPSLKIEREYLEAFTSVVSIEDWRAIVKRAVADAREGDDKARQWLAKYCLGKNPPSLKEVAVKEASGVTPREEIRRESEQVKSIASRIESYRRLMGISRGTTEQSSKTGGAGAGSPVAEV